MISAKVLAKQAEKFAVDNAPVILTGIGVVSSISAVVLTGKASFKAAYMIRKEQLRLDQMTPGPGPVKPMDKKAQVKLVWMEFIPPAGLLAVGVTAIVCSQRVSAKRVAALATAYSLSEKRFGEYREKVIEKFNGNKEREVRDEIAQDRIKGNPPDSQIILMGTGDVICYDLPTGRYFRSNMEKIRSVQNDINGQVVEIGFAALSDLYVALGLKETPYSEEVGWSTSKMLEIKFSAVLTDDNQPCISIEYQVEPIRHLSKARFRGCEEDPPF